jgi:hypothetical protein
MTDMLYTLADRGCLLLLAYSVLGPIYFLVGLIYAWDSSRRREVPGEGGEGGCPASDSSGGAAPSMRSDYAAEAERARDDGYDSDRDERWIEGT